VLADVWNLAGSSRVRGSDLRVLILEEVYGGDNSIGFGADTVARSKHGEKHGRKHGETRLKAWWKA